MRLTRVISEWGVPLGGGVGKEGGARLKEEGEWQGKGWEGVGGDRSIHERKTEWRT